MLYYTVGTGRKFQRVRPNNNNAKKKTANTILTWLQVTKALITPVI